MFYYEYIITSVISLFHINWFLTKYLETIYTYKDSTIHMYIIYILINFQIYHFTQCIKESM